MAKPTHLIILSVALLFSVLGCSFSGIMGKKTSTPTPQPTATPTYSPTVTALPPTPTPTRTNTQTPTEVPKVTVGKFEQALKDAGYYISYQGGGSKIWVFDDPSESIYTYTNGQVILQVVNNVNTRLSHVEKRLAIMDKIFPSDFMAQLREANEAYAATVGAGVTGDPMDAYGPDPNDEWKVQWGYYNVSDVTVINYKVRFDLFLLRLSCPEGYECSIPAFGRHRFVGQVSITLYEVNIWLGKK